MTQSFSELLDKALASRATLFDARHESAFRLFNGFSEGNPNLVVDLYAETILFHNYGSAGQNHYADSTGPTSSLIQEAQEFYRDRLPWLKAGLVKTRNAKSAGEKRGRILFGRDLDRKIKEHNFWYAIDLTLNQDASFYLDTRNLRKWISENVKGKNILNAFAYTGSLGVAALAGGASHVVQLDRNKLFLNLAKESFSLNGFPVRKQDLPNSNEQMNVSIGFSLTRRFSRPRREELWIKSMKARGSSTKCARWSTTAVTWLQLITRCTPAEENICRRSKPYVRMAI